MCEESGFFLNWRPWCACGWTGVDHSSEGAAVEALNEHQDQHTAARAVTP